MKLGCTYICVTDMEKSLDFYQKLLQQEPTYQNENRWAQFDIRNVFALYNAQYDLDKMNSSKDVLQCYNDAYQKYFQLPKHITNTNIVLNFEVDDLKKEYTRVKALNIGQVSPLFYVNIAAPYWYFTIQDPDGNELEITGGYDDKSNYR